MKKVLDSVGAKYDEKRVDTLIAELGGKDLGALIAAGNAKIGALGPIGGGGGGAAAPEAKSDKKADAKAGGDKKGADKKGGDKPKKEEPKEDEEDPDMGLSLFD